MSLITPVVIYSAITVNTDAYLAAQSPVVPQSQLNPAVINLSSVTGANAIALNFLIATGSTSVGSNAVLRFKYAFSNATYDTTTMLTSLFGVQNFNVTITPAVSATQDITTPPLAYITGNKLYVWYDQEHIQQQVTLSASVVPVSATVNPR